MERSTSLKFNPIDARSMREASSFGPPLVLDTAADAKSNTEVIRTFVKQNAFLPLLAIAGLALGSNLETITSPLGFFQPPVEEMTYNGMTLADFSVEMGMPIDHPYLVALFEQLCMSEAT